MNDALKTKPRYFRAPVARGLEPRAESPRVDREGGDYGAGLIRGVSVLTRGEAKGHGRWVDSTMLAQVAGAINDSGKGTKARFTHPSLSGDGLGSYLGRVRNAQLSGDQVTGDLHFSKAAEKTPDGNLADYLMTRAEESPDTFGVSIVFDPDFAAEEDFVGAHEDDRGLFQSPDEANTHHYPHARVARLKAADVVDEPAANPDGLFHRGQEAAQEADALLSYALGISKQRPTLSQFDIEPDRVTGFVARFLDSHGLEIKQKETEMSTDTKTDLPVDEQSNTPPEAEASPADATAVEGEVATEPSPETPEAAEEAPAIEASQPEAAEGDDAGTEEAEAEAPAEPAQLSEPESGRATEGEKFLEAFGDKGGVWFAQGKSFEEAQRLYTEELKAENDRLKQQLSARSARGVETPVTFAAESDPQSDERARLVAAYQRDGRTSYDEACRKADKVLARRAKAQKK